MNINEIREKKQKLSRDIKELCQEFSKETGVVLFDVDVKAITHNFSNGDSVLASIEVDIKLEL